MEGSHTAGPHGMLPDTENSVTGMMDTNKHIQPNLQDVWSLTDEQEVSSVFPGDTQIQKETNL